MCAVLTSEQCEAFSTQVRLLVTCRNLERRFLWLTCWIGRWALGSACACVCTCAWCVRECVVRAWVCVCVCAIFLYTVDFSCPCALHYQLLECAPQCG